MTHGYIVVPFILAGLVLLPVAASSAAPAFQPGPPGPPGGGGPPSSIFWSLTGNSGTNAATNFLGTTDNQAVEVRVNNIRALRLEPNATSPNLLGGDPINSVTAGAFGATIGGGGSGVPLPQPTPLATGANRVTDDFGTVSGGANNQAGDSAGTTGDRRFATVGGGLSNTASGGSSTVGGGSGHTASGNQATVAGGGHNTVSNLAGTAGGGQNNTVGGVGATVGGGTSNAADGARATVAGGDHNTASATAATVAGGSVNTASADGATVPGGNGNTAAGPYSFAAGFQGQANQSGTFVWADGAGGPFTSDALGANSFNARTSGGARFVNGSGVGVQLAAGGNSWAPVSDRSVKENFESVDAQAILEQLMALPIETWNLTSQEQAIRHMGPMAQDFYAMFGLGEDNQHISTVNADGVALAAIQGLYQLVQEQGAQLAAERAQNAALEARLAALEQAINGAR